MGWNKVWVSHAFAVCQCPLSNCRVLCCFATNSSIMAAPRAASNVAQKKRCGSFCISRFNLILIIGATIQFKIHSRFLMIHRYRIVFWFSEKGRNRFFFCIYSHQTHTLWAERDEVTNESRVKCLQDYVVFIFEKCISTMQQCQHTKKKLKQIKRKKISGSYEVMNRPPIL